MIAPSVAQGQPVAIITKWKENPFCQVDCDLSPSAVITCVQDVDQGSLPEWITPISLDQAYRLEYQTCMSHFWNSLEYYSYGYIEVGECIPQDDSYTLDQTDCIPVGEAGLLYVDEFGFQFHLPVKLAEPGSYDNFYGPTCGLSLNEMCICPTANERQLMDDLLQAYCSSDFKDAACKVIADSRTNCVKSCVGSKLEFECAQYEHCLAPYSPTETDPSESDTDRWIRCEEECGQKRQDDLMDLARESC
jgi:hypothetical protein